VQLASELSVDAVEYVPAKHWEHVPPFAPVNPALQVQAVIVLLATGEKEFEGQPRQAELPVKSLYVSPKQFVHVAPSFPVHPALQVQAVIVIVATGEKEFEGQPRQAELPVNSL